VLTSTGEDEAIIKHEVYLQLHKLSQELQKSTIISTDKDIKEYAVAVESEGTYDIYVKNDSFSREESIRDVAFSIADSTVEIALDASALWTKLTSIPLEEKLYRASLQINTTSNLFPENLFTNLESSQLQVTNAQNECSQLTLGTLRPGQYILSYTANTDNADTVLQTQTKAQTSITYVLPYNSKVIDMKGVSSVQTSHKLDIKFADTYVHHICNFYSNTNQDVTLDDIVLQKIDIPTLILVKNNPTYEQPPNTTIVNRKTTQTSEQFALSIGKPQLMIYNTHFDKRWNLSFANQKPVHLSGNGYSNVWTVDPTSRPSIEARIEFSPQNLANVGRIVSIIALVIILGALILL
jgi:hypothetical protein